MPYRLATPQYTMKKKEMGSGSPPNPISFMGWVMGLEPTTLGTTIRCSNQLSYTHHNPILLKYRETLVRQKGLEPPAYCLEGSCSIQLSYWRIWSG